MNVVDSSAWLDYFTEGPNASYFARAVEDIRNLVVPSIILYEVFKRVLRDRGENVALEIVAHMMQGRIIDLDGTLALEAAKASIEHKIPMADAIILTTARAHDAILWTQDDHFAGIKNVRYRKNS